MVNAVQYYDSQEKKVASPFSSMYSLQYEQSQARQSLIVGSKLKKIKLHFYVSKMYY